MAFGRFNPLTSGHMKVIDKVNELAQQYNAEHYIVLSHKHGDKYNPLDPTTKLKHVHEMFGVGEIADTKHPGIIQQAERINGTHTHLHVVAGADRVNEYQTLLDRYNGKNYQYESITVHSSGKRKGSGVENVSATKLRECARNGNYDGFISGLPPHTSKTQQLELYQDVRKGLGVLEETTGRALFLVGCR